MNLFDINNNILLLGIIRSKIIKLINLYNLDIDIATYNLNILKYITFYWKNTESNNKFEYIIDQILVDINDKTLEHKIKFDY